MLGLVLSEQVMKLRVVPSALHSLVLAPIRRAFKTMYDVLLPVVQARRRNPLPHQDVLQYILSLSLFLSLCRACSEFLCQIILYPNSSDLLSRSAGNY